MKLETKNVNEFVKVLDFASKTCQEPAWQFEQDKLKIHGKGSSQNSAFNIVIPKEFFEVYEPEEGQVFMDMEKINKIITQIDRKEPLCMEKKDNKMAFKSGRKRFKLALLNKEKQECYTPKELGDINIKLSAETLVDGIKTAKIFSERVDFKLHEQTFSVSSASDELEESTQDFVVGVDGELFLRMNAIFLEDTLFGATGEVELLASSGKLIRIRHKIGVCEYEAFISPVIIED